jgi:hypothetical protein
MSGLIRLAAAEDGELRLIIPEGGAVDRIFAITRLDMPDSREQDGNGHPQSSAGGHR